MLKKIYRITKDREYQAIYRRGRFQTTALFSVHFLRSKQNLSRVGIVVSKKISKSAVERNLLKRRVREIIQELHPRLNGNYDIVVAVKKPSLEADFAKMKTDLINAFTKAGLV